MGNLDLATITVIIAFAAAIMTIAMGGAIVVTIDDDVCPFFHDPSFLASPGAPALYVLSLCVPLSVCIPSLYIPASCTPHAPSLIAFLLLSLALLLLPLALLLLPLAFLVLLAFDAFLHGLLALRFLCLLPSLSSLEISGGGNLNEKNVGTIINIRTL